MFLKPITYKKQYDLAIARHIAKLLYVLLYEPMFAMIKSPVSNAKTSELQNAIIQGLVYYQDGAFYSRRKKFSNVVALELEEMGAKYSKSRNAYVIAKSRLNGQILWAIDTYNARTKTTVQSIINFLTVVQGGLGAMPKITFDSILNQMMLDLQKRVKANAKAHKIDLITPDIDDFMESDFVQKYSINLQEWVYKYIEDDIELIKKYLIEMSLQGKTQMTIAKFLKKRYNIDMKKALFIARNESATIVSNYLVQKYQAEGFEYFRWITNYDGRERPLHAELGKKTNNKHGINETNLFRFDNPPIIDERTEQRGYTGEAYNCRCLMSPYVDKDFVQRRRDLYKRSLILR